MSITIQPCVKDLYENTIQLAQGDKNSLKNLEIPNFKTQRVQQQYSSPRPLAPQALPTPISLDFNVIESRLFARFHAWCSKSIL